MVLIVCLAALGFKQSTPPSFIRHIGDFKPDFTDLRPYEAQTMILGKAKDGQSSDDEYVYVPIAPELASIRPIKLPGWKGAINLSRPTLTQVGEGGYSSLNVTLTDAKLSVALGFDSVSAGANLDYESLFVDAMYFHLVELIGQGTTDNKVYAAYGNGVRLTDKLTKGSLGIGTTTFRITGHLSVLNLGLSAYGVDEPLGIHLEPNDDGTCSLGNVMRGALETYNDGVASFKTAKPVILGLWVPKSWTQTPPK